MDLAATVGGVLWGAAVAILVPHNSEIALLLVLFLAVAPLAFVAALLPRFGVGPATAAIVVLIPQVLHTTPIGSATERVEEVLLGGLAGLLVSFVFLPSSAFQHARELAALALRDMARAVPELFEGFEHGLSEGEAHRIQDGIGQQLSVLLGVTAEAERERPLRLAEDPLTGPLFRTLLRLRHDLVLMGRAAHSPLPDALKEPLHARLQTIAREFEYQFAGLRHGTFVQAKGASGRGLGCGDCSVRGGNRSSEARGRAPASSQRGYGAAVRDRLRLGANAAEPARFGPLHR